MRNRRGSHKARCGITRGEVLVLGLLILVAAGFALRFLTQSRTRSAQVQCQENLRRIGVAIYQRIDLKPVWEEDVQKVKRVPEEKLVFAKRPELPPARLAEGYATWAVLLAPFIADKSPLTRWDLSQPFVDQPVEVRESVVGSFFCPARSRDTLLWSRVEDGKTMTGALGDYAAAAGDGKGGAGAMVDAVLKDGRIADWSGGVTLSDLLYDEKKGTRGLAYIILIGEKHVPQAQLGVLEVGDGSLYDGRRPPCYARFGGPGHPLAAQPDAEFRNNFGSYHPGYCHFLFAALNVRAIGNDIEAALLGQMIRRND